MAWYSYTLALPLEITAAKAVNAHADLTGLYSSDAPFVYSSSRNGVLLGLLSQIYRVYQPQGDFYLLQDFAKLETSALETARYQLGHLLEHILQEPALVSEATKSPYTPYLTLQTEGFEPIAAEVVYPPDALFRDGYYYEYPPERVLHALHQAQAGNSLDLPHDPDGESLEYLFCFLKSHLALLQTLDPTQQVLIYGELNRS